MKLQNLLIIAFFVKANRAFTQNVEKIYCILGDTLVIQETGRDTLNNTIYVDYHESFNNTNFTITSRNDATLSIFSGNEYFLGTVNATVGEIWNPLWYPHMSVTDTSMECSTRTLEVRETGIMNYGGVNLRYVILTEENWSGFSYYTYIEHIGITHGGPLYSYLTCPQMTDIPDAQFMSYTDDILTYSENVECDDSGLNENELFEVNIIVNSTYLEVKSDERIVKMKLICTSGKILNSSENERMELNRPLTPGMYILIIKDEKNRLVSRKINVSI